VVTDSVARSRKASRIERIEKGTKMPLHGEVKAVLLVLSCALGLPPLGCSKNGNGSGAASAAQLAKKAQDIGKKVNDALDAANKVADATQAVTDHLSSNPPGSAASATPNGAPDPKGADPAAASQSASAPGAAQAQAKAPGGGASAFAGTWLCAATADIAPASGRPVHLQGAGPWIVVDNGEGTISLIDPKNSDPQCPPGRWAVSGSTATAVTNQPCTKRDGSVISTVRGNGTLSGNSLVATGALAVSGASSAQVGFALRCSR
jgi:hypothetical protein